MAIFHCYVSSPEGINQVSRYHYLEATPIGDMVYQVRSGSHMITVELQWLRTWRMYAYAYIYIYIHMITYV